jgi:hypothetical protein
MTTDETWPEFVTIAEVARIMRVEDDRVSPGSLRRTDDYAYWPRFPDSR